MGLRGARAIIAIASHRETSTSLSTYLLRPKFFCPPSRRTRPLLVPFQTGGGPRMIRSVDEATGDPVTSKGSEVQQQPDDWKVKMLYDGDCPLCMREVNMLRERNQHYRTIKFVDISSEDYSPQQNQGLDYETVMGRIHAIMSDGTVVTDVEAFRKLYEQVGLGWVYAITKYKPIAAIADAVYGVWAKYRLQITGRPGLEKILEARKQNKVKVCRDNQNCKI